MNRTRPTRPIILTIAGFDSSGGAGIIADVRTIESFGCSAVAAITSITFQNAKEFRGAVHQPAASVRAQIESILAEHEIAAVKIGMLPTAEVVREVARLIREKNLPAPVVDPVMESTSGSQLMSDDAFEVFVTELLSLARVVTPNIPEAEKLSGINIEDEQGMQQAAARIRELGARAVLVKGGHLKQQKSEIGSEQSEREAAIDLLDDGGEIKTFRAARIDVPNVRGTGCMLSAAIAACLANGDELATATSSAKAFVSEAIQNSKLKTKN